MANKTRPGIWWCVLGCVALGCGAQAEGEPTAGEEHVALGAAAQPIIGGRDALLGEWPWQVQLNRYGNHWCGGSVLNERWVITAAHCVQGELPSAFEVRTGLIDRDTPGAQSQAVGVSQLIVHPDYDPFAISSDVALMELDADLAFDEFTQPIALSTSTVPVGAQAVVTGWGWTQPFGSSSVELMEAVLPIRDTTTCNTAGTLPLTVDDTMVCAGHLLGEKGGCHGDSGGPLVVQSSAFSMGWELVGLVSWGVGGTCSSYTVFNRVSEFATWVEGIVGDTPVLGDVNGDGCVDTADHNDLMASFGQAVPPADASLDLNGDGVVDIFDRMIVLENFGEGC